MNDSFEKANTSLKSKVLSIKRSVFKSVSMCQL